MDGAANGRVLRILRLRDFLIHAGQTVPYYRRLFRDTGFNPERFQSLHDLTALPVLSKQTVQALRQTLPPRRFRLRNA